MGRMPKILHLLRHAKSSWKNPDLEDRDRPLNKRGRNNAPMMAARFSTRYPMPDQIFTSPAFRAFSTAELFASGLHASTSIISIVESLYAATADQLISNIREIDNQYQRVMLVAHNPEITSLVDILTGMYFENIPTCGLVSLELDSDSWADIAESPLRLIDFDYPRKT